MDGFKFDDFKRAWEERFTEDPALELDCFNSELGVSDRDKFELALRDCRARIAYLQDELTQQEFIAAFLTVALRGEGDLDASLEKPAVSVNSSFHCDTGNSVDSDRIRAVVNSVTADTDPSTFTDRDASFRETRFSSTCKSNLSQQWTQQDSEALKKAYCSSIYSNISDCRSSGPPISPNVSMQQRDSSAASSPFVSPVRQEYPEERIYDEPFAVVRGELDRDESVESSDEEEPLYYNVLLMKHQSQAAHHAPVYANTKVLLEKHAELSRSTSSETDSSCKSFSLPAASSPLCTSTWKKRQSMQLATNLPTPDPSQADELDMVVSPCPEAETLQMRQWVISSILDSERDYVDVLNTLQQYMKTFKSLAETPHVLIATEDIDTIFCNIPELYRIHCDFICQLEPRVKCWTSKTQIAELFKLLALEEYPLATKYLKNYHDAVAAIRRCSQQNAQFREVTQEISCKGVAEKPSLEELLHKPVVRVQRNTLALHDLIKCTPTSHSDYDMLQKTLKIGQNFLENFNETMDKDNVENMRYLVKQGLVVERVGSQRKLRHLFVFKDVIVGAKQRMSNRQKVNYDCKWYIALADLELDTRTGAQDEPCVPDARRREISVIEHRVSILQKELKAEMKKMRLAEQGQRHWSTRSHTKNIDKLKRKLAEQEAALLKVSPHLLFTLKDKKVDKTYYLLMSSDYERSVWRDTILGLMAQARVSVNLPLPDLQLLINSQKKVQASRLTLETDDLGLDEEYLFGSLYVTIHKLQGLDVPCDCFCAMETDAFGYFCNKAKTSIVCGSIEPAWNEGFEIDLEGAQTLRILCYKLGNETDSLLGKCALELSRAWLRGDFQEKMISLNEKVQLTLSLKYINSQQTLSRKPSAVKGGIFGVKLGVTATREGTRVPIIITSCIDEIEKRGLGEVGLYRVSGLSGEIQSLKKAFEKNSRGAVQLLADIDIHVVTSLLKLYFRELPEALFTDHLYPHLLEGTSLADPEAKEKCMVSLLLSLPHHNLTTIIVTLNHLVRLSENPENKMTINNLSTVFGPTLLKPAAKTESSAISIDLFSEGARDAMMQTNILHYFLTLRAKGRDFGIKT